MAVYLRVLAMVFAAFISSSAFADKFDSDGSDIFYTVAGEGEAVVLIHGQASTGAGNWDINGVSKSLASRFKVIAMDVRGHGQSAKPHNPKAYGLQLVKDVVNLLDHLNIEKAHIVGYSMGGMIASKLMVMHPERVLKVVSGGFGWWSQDSDLMPVMIPLAESLEAGDGLLPLFAVTNPIGQPPPSEEQMKMMSQQVLSTNDPLALAAMTRSFAELTVSEQELRNNKIPLLYIVGELDPRKYDIERAEGIVSNSKTIIAPGTNHMSTVINPVLQKSIEDFLIGG